MTTMTPPDGVARRLAQRAWDAARDRAWPQVRRHDDHRLARRLTREAQAAQRAHAAAIEAHRSAVARRERVRRRSRRAVPIWTALAGGAAVAAVPLAGSPELAVGAVAVLGAGRVATAVWRLRRPPAVPPAPSLPAPPPAPPPPRSAAFPAVRRLEQARATLQSLLPLVGPAGRAAAEEAWNAAADADTALRWCAARLAAAERHAGVDAGLLARLEAGVAEQERLVHAVADLVSASAHPHDTWRLQDVADRVHGLAMGLRAVR
jgi:hypothetical protein